MYLVVSVSILEEPLSLGIYCSIEIDILFVPSCLMSLQQFAVTQMKMVFVRFFVSSESNWALSDGFILVHNESREQRVPWNGCKTAESVHHHHY